MEPAEENEKGWLERSGKTQGSRVNRSQKDRCAVSLPQRSPRQRGILITQFIDEDREALHGK